MYLSSEGSFGLRRSCTEEEVRRPTFWWFCVNPGIPPQMPQKVTTHIYITFFSLVACRRLSSSEGAPAGVGEVCWAKPRSRRRYQAQERSLPAAVPTAAWRETWLGLTKHNSRKYIVTREISTSLGSLSAVFIMCYANAHAAIGQLTCTELARGP